MIDLHNHILPKVDDGAADLEESLDIARQFVSEGVTRIAATPHLDPENRRGPRPEQVMHLVGEVQQVIDSAGISLRVEPGQEIYLTPEVPNLLKEGAALRLGAGHAVLVELSLTAGQRPLYLEDTMFQLQLAGLQPILAHPERYAFVQRDPTAVDPLVDAGVVLQVTAPALLGLYGGHVRRVCERLLRRGSYALASSDRHHPGPERSLAEAYKRIVELTDEDTAELLLRQNPERLLDGSDPLRPAVRLSDDRSFLDRIFSRS